MAEKRIGAQVYKFEPILAWEAFDLFETLLDVIGPLAPVLDAVMVEDDEKRSAGLIQALAVAIQGRNKVAIRHLMETLISNCRCNGEACVVGVKPATLDEMMQVALFAAEVQFASFFEGGAVASLWSKIQASTKEA